MDIGDMRFSFQYKFKSCEDKIRRVPSIKCSTLFQDTLLQTVEREKRDKPFIICRRPESKLA